MQDLLEEHLAPCAITADNFLEILIGLLSGRECATDDPGSADPPVILSVPGTDEPRPFFRCSEPVVDRVAGTISWTLTPLVYALTADVEDVVFGENDLLEISVSFVDRNGNATIPFDPFDPPMTLADLLAVLPDGTVLVMEWTFTNGVGESGSLEAVIENGVVIEVSGGGSFGDGRSCSIDFSFAHTPEDMRESHPPAEIQVDLWIDEMHIQAMISVTGGQQASVSVRINDEFEQAFVLDLDTGEVR